MQTYQEQIISLLQQIAKNTGPKKRKAQDKNFVPPSMEEVKAYAATIVYEDIDEKQFVDFYASKGWMIGKNKMKDWRAAVRTWKRRDGINPRTGKKKETSAEQGARIKRENKVRREQGRHEI